jgi:hypothetical protein
VQIHLRICSIFFDIQSRQAGLMDHGVTLAVALLSLGEVQKTGMALRKNGSGTCHWPRPDMFGLSRARGRVFYRKMETATYNVRVTELCHRAKQATPHSYLIWGVIDRK